MCCSHSIKIKEFSGLSHGILGEQLFYDSFVGCVACGGGEGGGGIASGAAFGLHFVTLIVCVPRHE